MLFTYGCTRWVIFCGPYVIKVARFRFIRPLMRLFQTTRDGVVKKELKKYDGNVIIGGLKYLLAGIVANRSEYRHWQKHQQSTLVPTPYSFFGIFNIQKRGRGVTMRDRAILRKHILWQMPLDIENDIRHPRQFCIIGETAYLADYGSHQEILDAMTRL